MFPGRRENGALTRFASGRTGVQTTIDVTVDAALKTDRQREGGGAPSERRPADHSRWQVFLDAVGARWRGDRTTVLAAPVAEGAAPGSRV